MERNEILNQLEKQFSEDFAGQGYKNEFKPDGGKVECNFGGLLLILGNSGESVIVWSDWSGNALSEKLTECEIEYIEDEESEPDEDGYKDNIPAFMFQDSWVKLGDFMRIDN